MISELIEWHEVSEKLPDDDVTVLIRIRDNSEPVWLGWLDGDGKWYAVDAVEHEVIRWANIPTGDPK